MFGQIRAIDLKVAKHTKNRTIGSFSSQTHIDAVQKITKEAELY